MHPLIANKQNSFKALAGTQQDTFIHVYQMLESVSWKPQVMREANPIDKSEPIGDASRIPKKYKYWEPNLILNSDEDPTDDTAPEYPEGHEAFIEKGYQLDDSGMYKKMVSKDTTPLAAYGYYLQTDLVTMSPKEEPIEMTSAYNMHGHYIGTAEDAEYLCVDRGIIPELASDTHNVCSVGYSHKDGKYYGWSHRAIHGFGIGDKVKFGDCAYTPDTMENAVKKLNEWHNDPEFKNVRYSVSPKGEDEKNFYLEVVRSEYSDEEAARDRDHEHIRPEDAGWVITSREVETVPKGRGEWAAEDHNHVREMAYNFAESVSVSVEPILVDKGCNFIEDVESYSAVESVSAQTKNPLDYGWYRYVGTRVKSYKKHHRSQELYLENGEKFGIRFGRNAVYLVEETSMQYEFKLTEREAQNLLKVAKPFGGKIDNIRVTKGNGDIQQMSGKTNKVASHTQGRRDAPKRETTVEKPKTQRTPLKDVTYFGFFKPSANQDRYAFVEDDSVAAVKEKLDKFMVNNKNLGSGANIFKASGAKSRGLSMKLGSKKLGYILGPVYTNFAKQMRPVAKDYLPDQTVVFDETVKVPQFNQSQWKPKEPIYYSNEAAVLAELQEAVIREKFFSGLFAQDQKRLRNPGRVKKDSKGNHYVLFVTDLVNRQTMQEAQRFIKRIQDGYNKAYRGTDAGDAFVGDVQLIDRNRLTVRVFLVLKKTSADQQKRSRLLHDLVVSTEKRRVNSGKINSLLQDIPRAEPAEAKRMQREIEKLSNEMVEDKILAYNMPVYSISAGQGVFRSVELVRIDIPTGKVFVRPVRDRKLEEERQVKSLYSLDGSKQLL